MPSVVVVVALKQKKRRKKKEKKILPIKKLLFLYRDYIIIMFWDKVLARELTGSDWGPETYRAR